MKVNISSMKVLGNRLLVETIENTDSLLDRTSGGIILYNKSKHKGRQVLARIHKLGSEFYDGKMKFKTNEVFSEGDIVTLYAPALSCKVTDNDTNKDFYLVRAEDVDAILEITEGELNV